MRRVIVALVLGLLSFSTALAADTVKTRLMDPMSGSWASEGQEK